MYVVYGLLWFWLVIQVCSHFNKSTILVIDGFIHALSKYCSRASPKADSDRQYVHLDGKSLPCQPDFEPSPRCTNLTPNQNCDLMYYFRRCQFISRVGYYHAAVRMIE